MIVVTGRRPHLLKLRHRFLCQHIISFHALFRVAGFHSNFFCKRRCSLQTQYSFSENKKAKEFISFFGNMTPLVGFLAWGLDPLPCGVSSPHDEGQWREMCYFLVFFSSSPLLAFVADVFPMSDAFKRVPAKTGLACVTLFLFTFETNRFVSCP